jgi:hypothetical protein
VPGFVQHAGGLAGSGPMRRVSPALFLGAPRYHGGGIAGLAPDEVPSILRRGEEVLTRDDPRHMANMGGAGSVRVEVVNRGTPIRAQQATTRMDATGMVVQIITEDVQRNGPIRRALESIRGR